MVIGPDRCDVPGQPEHGVAGAEGDGCEAAEYAGTIKGAAMMVSGLASPCAASLLPLVRWDIAGRAVPVITDGVPTAFGALTLALSGAPAVDSAAPVTLTVARVATGTCTLGYGVILPTRVM